MADIRELLAVVLGVLFGLVLLAAPRAALKLSVLSGPQGRRRDGEWGADDPVPAWLVWVVRALGLACLGVAAFIAV